METAMYHESWYIAKQGDNAMNGDTGILPGV